MSLLLMLPYMGDLMTFCPFIVTINVFRIGLNLQGSISPTANLSMFRIGLND